MNAVPITQGEVRQFLTDQMPTAAPAELDRASSALVLLLKVASAAPPAKPAPPKKPRQYKEKSLAESQKLKRT